MTGVIPHTSWVGEGPNVVGVTQIRVVPPLVGQRAVRVYPSADVDPSVA